MISFANVGFAYQPGEAVLRDVSLALEPGSFHFLTGPSGAGKSTLLGLMHLRLRPTTGEVRIFGQKVAGMRRSEMPALRQKIGVVFQDFRLLDHLSTFDNVALPLRLTGQPHQAIRRDVTEMLEWVGLGHALDVGPKALSGGEQQRIAIARAVISRPRVLLADEPTGSVDHSIGVRIIRLFEELNRLGTAVVIATHNSDLIERFPHAQLDLQDGTLFHWDQPPGSR